MPARNAPCPCGSGRKYEHCCLRAAAAARPAYTAQERQDAFGKLARFAQREELAGERRDGSLLFWAGRLDLADASQRHELEADDQSFVAFLTWLMFDRIPEPGIGTIADRFVEARASTLTSGERAYLDRMRASRLRLYEVVEIRPDAGLRLRDLWTDEIVEVQERLGTRQLARWDLMAVRVIEGPDGAPVLDGIPYPYPRDAKAALLTELRSLHQRLSENLPDPDPDAFFKQGGMVFHHLWLDHVALRPLPTIVTAEGDRVTFAKVVFDVADRPKVEAALAGHTELYRQDDGSYVWLEAGPGFQRGLGAVVLARRRLSFETTSEPRAERGRAFIEALLGGAVRFRATRYESLASALERGPRREKLEELERREKLVESGVPPEVEREVVPRFYEQHYRAWLDEPIPALDGRTPRHAARLKTQRSKVVELLKGLENQMEHERLRGRPAVDVGWMWEELRLERP